MESQTEEYYRKAQDLEKEMEATLRNIEKIAKESERVATIDMSGTWANAES